MKRRTPSQDFSSYSPYLSPAGSPSQSSQISRFADATADDSLRPALYLPSMLERSNSAASKNSNYSAYSTKSTEGLNKSPHKEYELPRTRPSAWPTSSTPSKWSWRSRQGKIWISAVLVTLVLFVSLTAFGVDKAVQARKADLAAEDQVAVTVAVAGSMTATETTNGKLTTEVKPTTRFSTSIKPASTASAALLTPPAASGTAIAIAAPIVPQYNYGNKLFGAATNRSDCFPYASPETLSLSSAPSLTPQQWWCQSSLLYGWLGFSYALESDDCSDSTNSFAQINKDFARMKSQFGATMVRIYAPECREISIWQNLVKAAVANEMGLLPMVWWGFESQSLWKTSQAQLYSLFKSGPYAEIAPYVVHSIAFGSEPMGDGVDGSSFIKDLAKFRATMNGYGIPVAISEDWDRTGDIPMNSTSGALGSLGAQVKSNTDLVHAHIQPYYHPTEVIYPQKALSYISIYLDWLNTYVGQPVLVTESMWPSAAMADHTRGGNAVSEAQVGKAPYEAYWALFTENCDLFKEKEVGWFMHSYSDDFEAYFGLLSTADASQPKMSWNPPSC